MYNAISRITIATVMLAVVTACGNKDKAGAEALLQESRQAVEQHNYTRAIELLDTINSRYRTQTEVRRDALGVRAEAMEGIAIDSISAGDRALAEATLRVEALEGDFKYVKSSVGLDGYYLPKDASDKVLMSTGVQGRVSDDGHFYLVANVQGRNMGLRAVRFAQGSEQCQTADISPSRVIKVEGSETASFTPEDLEGLSTWLGSHDGALKCTLIGAKTTTDVKLTTQQCRQLSLCGQYADALQAKRLALVHREKYERMLAAARDQLANLQQPSDQK